MLVKKEFRLDKWLKSSKKKAVMTKDDVPVTILTYEKRDNTELIENGEDYPIVALINYPNPIGDRVGIYNRSGKLSNKVIDLPDMNQLYVLEDAAKEFEKGLSELISLSKSCDKDELLEEYAPQLLKAAEEEIKQGLPKWRRQQPDEKYIHNKGYYLTWRELEELPKED
jgi:hypothetical protein